MKTKTTGMILLLCSLCACGGRGNGKSGSSLQPSESPKHTVESRLATHAGEAGRFSRGTVYTLQGELRIGHEVRSFVPAGSREAYWIVDTTGQLCAAYDRAAGGQKNGHPLNVTLTLEYDGQWEDGFAAEYAGTFLFRSLDSIDQ